MDLPLNRISVLDPAQPGLLATGLAVKTVGVKTECRMSLALSDTEGLKLPVKTWFRTRMARRGLLAVDQRRLNGDRFERTDESEGTFDPSPDPTARREFAVAVSADGGVCLDCEVNIELVVASSDMALGLGTL